MVFSRSVNRQCQKKQKESIGQSAKWTDINWVQTGGKDKGPDRSRGKEAGLGCYIGEKKGGALRERGTGETVEKETGGRNGGRNHANFAPKTWDGGEVKGKKKS